MGGEMTGKRERRDYIQAREDWAQGRIGGVYIRSEKNAT
jgi:hypothetical protein